MAAMGLIEEVTRLPTVPTASREKIMRVLRERGLVAANLATAV
jgi:hypothetical protein